MKPVPMPLEIRPYLASDENAWLRCRLLSFFGTAYFDDVVRTKPRFAGPAIELVALEDDAVVGIIDVTYDADNATIDTVAVDPARQADGIGMSLLNEAITALPAEVISLDAWTRDDAATLAWYERQGFSEQFRYLHVYAQSDAETLAAIRSTGHGLTPVQAFFHADINHEDQMRATFKRVHICRQFARPI